MTATADVILELQKKRAPSPLLDFVAWVGPRLEVAETPEAFLVLFELGLSELAEGKSETGGVLRGSLVRQPPYVYALFTTCVEAVALAYRGPEFALEVASAKKCLT